MYRSMQHEKEKSLSKDSLGKNVFSSARRLCHGLKRSARAERVTAFLSAYMPSLKLEIYHSWTVWKKDASFISVTIMIIQSGF